MKLEHDERPLIDMLVGLGFFVWTFAGALIARALAAPVITGFVAASGLLLAMTGMYFIKKRLGLLRGQSEDPDKEKQ